MIDLTQDIQQDYLIGEFKTKNGQIILLIIYIPGAGPLKRIGRTVLENNDIFFGANPIELQVEAESTMDVIITKSAKINLLCKKHLADLLFTGDSRNIIVNVWQLSADNYQKCLFAGFVEPNIYNQQYAANYDTLTINCTCPLCTLQYYPYKSVYTEDQYKAFREQADKASIESILSNILGRLPRLNLLTDTPNIIYYDGCIRTDANAEPTSIFRNVYLFELLFGGDSKDDMFMEDEVLEEVLKYFNLHITTDGYTIRIFHYDSIKNRQTIHWYPIALDNSYYVSQSKMLVFDSEAREMLINVSDSSDTLPGNLLSVDYESAVVYRNGEYVNLEYAVLPDESTAYTGNWRTADLSDWLFLDVTDDAYYILVQDTEGNYNIEQMKEAPEQCFDASTGAFIYSYYIVDDDSYTVDEN